MIEIIRIINDIPNVAQAGELEIPSGIVDHNFAAALIRNGLAELVKGDLDSPKPRLARKGR